MTTDKDLLELAAKAAGIAWVRHAENTECASLLLKKGGWWNPLTDDGDALRLAVKLGITIYAGPVNIQVECREGSFIEPRTADPYAATRRAIVRAAAEIGEEKK